MKRIGNLYRWFFLLYVSLKDFHPLASNMAQIVVKSKKSWAMKEKNASTEIHLLSSCLKSAFSKLGAVDHHTPEQCYCSKSMKSASDSICFKTNP